MTLAFSISRIDSTSSDDVLLAAIATGDRYALELLYERHFDRLVAFAASLPTDLDAEDIVQDVFLSLLEVRCAPFQPGPGNGLTWLKGVVRREAMGVSTPPPRASFGGRRGAR